jgi:hypothetical protein
MNVSVWQAKISGRVRVGVSVGGTMHIVEPEEVPAIQAMLAQTADLLQRIGTDAWTDEDQRKLEQEGYSFGAEKNGGAGGYLFVGEEVVAFAEAIRANTK